MSTHDVLITAVQKENDSASISAEDWIIRKVVSFSLSPAAMNQNCFQRHWRWFFSSENREV